jgi:CheY-like chemotaxis protein
MNLKPILLVEDDLNDVELTLAALDELSLANQVLHLRDGAAALDYLCRRGEHTDRPAGNPAVVLLDLKMPKVDGLSVLRTIRTEESLRLIPVVMLTSSREESDLVASYKLGSNAYVVKPIGATDFIASIRELGMFWALLNESPPGSAKAQPGGARQQPDR